MVRRILEGTRIVDWTVYQVGPFATAMLADLGAEVIHLEEPEHGELLRGLDDVVGNRIERPGGRQINFEEHNRNKKGMAVDLKKPEGREIVYRLVSKSDVFVTNYRTGAVEKLGMDYKTLKRYNPSLVYARSSAFGDKGPIAEKGSVDAIGGARSGLSMACGEPGAPPAYVSPGVGDRVVSVYLAYGILAGLLAKEKWGIGQEITMSQLGSLISIQGFSLMVTLFQQVPKEFPRFDITSVGNPLFNYYKCSDGKWMVIAMVSDHRGRWEELCRAIGTPELADDPRFASFEARKDNAKELIVLLNKAFVKRTQKEWEEIFNKTDVLISPCRELSEVQNDPQVLENGYITEWDHPALGKIKFVGTPVQFSECPAELRLPAPELGQHTEEVLTEVCGYSWDDVVKLKEAGAIP